MKGKAVYESESDIPADLKDLYHLVNGKWVFNYAEFEGLAELANPALAATKEDIRLNKIKAENDLKLEKERADAAEKKARELEKPGMVFITKEESADFEKYKELGTVKDVKAKVDNEKVATEKLSLVEGEKAIRTLARDTGVDPEALVDFKINTAHGKDVVLGKEKRKVKNGNKEVEREVLVVEHIDDINGEKKKRTELFSEFASNKSLPKYIVDGILNAQVVEVDKGKQKKEFHLPITSNKKTEEGETSAVSTARDIVKRGNDSRNTRQLPFMKTAAKEEK